MAGRDDDTLTAMRSFARTAHAGDLGIAGAEALVEKFYALRGQEPDGGEPIAGLQQRVRKSLHAGRYRAVTWSDREHDVVWLLVAGIHRADSPEDAYTQAIALEQAGTLYPTADDYAALLTAERRQRLNQEAAVLMRLPLPPLCRLCPPSLART